MKLRSYTMKVTMMNRIIQLDEQTRNKIAAGEVVERPVSVVKEMLENSIDANSTSIEIDILDGGTTLIRIKDDGDGIPKEDIPLAFTRYATSKIEKFNDLFNLQSFGFRGEALASIASISQIEIETATYEDIKTNTYIINLHESTFGTEKPYRKGTVISVNHLFYNVPVRKKFLSSINKEFSLIYDLVIKYSIEFPSIDFTLTHQNELIYTSRGYNTKSELFLKNFGFDLQSKLLTFENLMLSNKVCADVLMLQESINKHTKQYEIFFINGRLVKSKLLESIVDEVYYTLIPKGRFPLIYLSFQIPSEALDVNIHPSKKEVKIHGIEAWREKLIHELKESLWKANISNFQYKNNYENLLSSNTSVAPHNDFFSNNEVHTTNLNFIAKDDKKPQLEIFYEEKANKNTIDVNDNLSETTQTKENPSEINTAILQKKDLSQLEVIGQLNNTFILAQNRDGLYIIDQHTCHERILYERLMKKNANNTQYIQSLLLPETMTLTPVQEETLLRHILTLRQLGFILEKSDNNLWSINGIPKAIGNANPITSYVSDLLDRLETLNDFDNAQLIEEILTTASCKGAVKANWRLSHEDIIYLLHELEKTDNPHTCPHGRPIVFRLTMQELYTIFDRGAYKNKLI